MNTIAIGGNLCIDGRPSVTVPYDVYMYILKQNGTDRLVIWDRVHFVSCTIEKKTNFKISNVEKL